MSHNEFTVISIDKKYDILSGHAYKSEPENNLITMGIFPLIVRGKPKGFLAVVSSSMKYFSESSISAIKILIAQTEVALECAELNRQTQEMIISNERILIGQAIHKDIIDSLFSVILELEEDKKKISSDPDFVMKSFVDIEQRVKKSLEDLRGTIFKLREN
ncbi:MAG: hypothetical protein HY776_02740 [Actinobacteria bacterium]|nr:hypothetical protein [Actinomycetota bacterium]